jgi:hypothetical protein
MSNYPNGSSQPWAIVIADEHGPGLTDPTDSERLPVQYCRVGQEATPLQQALQRAASVAPASQIILTAVEEYRQCWESAAWFIRPDRRFIGEKRWASQLSSAAVILSVAARSRTLCCNWRRYRRARRLSECWMSRMPWMRTT